VKIDPNYAGPVVYVKDASRAVGVCTQLLSEGLRDDYVARLKADYARTRERHLAQKSESKRVTLAEARDNQFKTDWSAYAPPRPNFLGTRVFREYDLADLVAIIDWTPFFQPGNCTGATRASWRTRWWARKPASCSPMPRPCSSGSSTSNGWKPGR
jgi:5-methyltetrahydrofolate--homocysteine methyltransferase